MTIWDTANVERYEAWYRSPQGAIALAREQCLLVRLLSTWQRRNQTLLDIGCGAGHFLDIFHTAGFDVTGLDQSEAMLDLARVRMGNRATLRLGNAEHLPFDDDEFDYVAIITALEYMDDQETALAEAFRVASKGVVIAWFNAWSACRLELLCRNAWHYAKGHIATWLAEWRSLPLSGLEQPGILCQARWLSPLYICRIIRKMSGRYPTVFRSTLFLPSLLWGICAPFSWAQIAPFGAVSMARIDLVPMSPVVTAMKQPKLLHPAGMHAGLSVWSNTRKCGINIPSLSILSA